MMGSIEESFAERERSQARLRQFVADASHELRTPVATIRGYAELFRTGGLSSEDALADAMRRTEAEAVRMGGLVDDLLALARLDQGRPLHRAPVDLAQVLRDAATDARAVDPERPVEVVIPDTLSADALVVSVDEPHIRQVVANLVGNALVHTPAGTPVTLASGVDTGVAFVEVARPGAGHARRGGGAGVRTLLPGRPITLATPGGQRAGPGHRGGNGRGPWRHRHPAVRSGPGHHGADRSSGFPLSAAGRHGRCRCTTASIRRTTGPNRSLPAPESRQAAGRTRSTKRATARQRANPPSWAG